MRRIRLLWQVFPPYLSVTLTAILVVTWYASKTLQRSYREQTASNLEIRARLVEDRIPRPLDLGNREEITDFCKEIAGKAPIRLTVVLPSGQVLGDSDKAPKRMDNHASRPEIRKALEGEVGQSVRYSDTIKTEMMYVALPIRESGKVQGVVRSSVPLTEIDRTLSQMYRRIFLSALVMASLAAFASWVLSKRISGPLEILRQGVLRIAHGDFSGRLPVPDTLEMADLAEAVNHMAAQLEERIDAVRRQHSQLNAVLSSMVEGVIALDMEKRILSLNNAAAEILGIASDVAQGRSIHESTRHAELLRFIEKTFGEEETAKEDIRFQNGKGERLLQASGTQLFDADSNAIGVLIVLNDVTQVRNLEAMRREFVANVSHEIRTPITSIKGFVETLLEGALKDPEDSKRFLRIIARQADRLDAIVEDILTLSRLDRVSRPDEFTMSETILSQLLRSAIEVCELKAKEKSIEILLNCPEEIEIFCNSNLLEQAVINLVDNAIKYSASEKTVLVEAKTSETSTAISVQDQGCGIGGEHFSRLFERFYRVDKARSRTMGGTGLGLAIVKHIVRFHGGVVNVTSELGEGSRFSIELPVGNST